MATIIEGAQWTLTDDAAEEMEIENLIKKCEAEHPLMLEVDKPIYHIHPKAPDWFGFTTIAGTIIVVENAIEKSVNDA